MARAEAHARSRRLAMREARSRHRSRTLDDGSATESDSAGGSGSSTSSDEGPAGAQADTGLRPPTPGRARNRSIRSLGHAAAAVDARASSHTEQQAAAAAVAPAPAPAPSVDPSVLAPLIAAACNATMQMRARQDRSEALRLGLPAASRRESMRGSFVAPALPPAAAAAAATAPAGSPLAGRVSAMSRAAAAARASWSFETGAGAGAAGAGLLAGAGDMRPRVDGGATFACTVYVADSVMRRLFGHGGSAAALAPGASDGDDEDSVVGLTIPGGNVTANQLVQVLRTYVRLRGRARAAHARRPLPPPDTSARA